MEVKTMNPDCPYNSAEDNRAGVRALLARNDPAFALWLLRAEILADRELAGTGAR